MKKGTVSSASTTDICNYLEWLKDQLSTLKDCFEKKKIIRLYFTHTNSNHPTVIDCEVLIIGEAFVEVKKSKTIHGDSIDGSKNEEYLIFVQPDRFLSKVEETNISVKEVSHFVDAEY